MDSSQARKNLRRVLEGKSPRRRLSRAEARARLRAADPAVDIGASLAHLNRGELGEAGLSLVVESVIALSLPALRSLLLRTAERLLAEGKGTAGR